MKRLLSDLVNNFDWFPITIGGTAGLCLLFIFSIMYKDQQRAEKERLNQEIVTFTIRCVGIPDQSVKGTSVHSNIVGSDMIHVYRGNVSVGAYPQTCTVSAE